MDNLNTDTLILIVWFIAAGIFLIIFVAAAIFAVRFQSRVHRTLFSRELKPGEVLASHRLGSRRIEKLYDQPGRYRFFPDLQVRWELVRVNEPVFIASEPTEIQVQGGVSVILTVRLTMDVATPTRYVTAVIGQELEDWRRQVLPGLIAQAASRYAVAQILNDRGEVSDNIARGIGSWLSDSQAPNLGLTFRAAAITNAATRANRPPRSRAPGGHPSTQ